MDVIGQADLRGINIDKAVKGFADEDIIFKKFVMQSTTNARENRYFTKTSGFVDTTDTTGITASQIPSKAWGARPPVAYQSLTRNTAYVKPFMVESEWMAEADIKDCDVDILGIMLRDLTRAVGYQVDKYIWDTITENRSTTNINEQNALWGVWTASASGNPVLDITRAKTTIRQNGYNPEGAVLAMNASAHEALLNWLITQKGSSIPQYSSEKIRSGAIMGLLGVNIAVSENVTDTYACMWVPNRTATLKTFTAITGTTIVDEGIGRKIRVWAENTCFVTDPKSVVLLSGITA